MKWDLVITVGLKSKLMIAFIGLIVVPIICLGYFTTRITSDVIRDTAVKSAVRSNEQVIKNLDNFLQMLAKLSEYPITDKEVQEILSKQNLEHDSFDYAAMNNMGKLNEFVYYKILSFSNMIDSAALYQAGSNKIFGRSPTDFLNIDYSPKDEEWFQKIIERQGAHTIIGIHREKQLSPKQEYVVSVGRSIVEPGTRKLNGVIVINVGIRKLEKLWLDTRLTAHSQFYLVDQDNKVIFSKDNTQVNQDIYHVLDGKINLHSSTYEVLEINGKKFYIISSASEFSGWKAITVIPQEELFSYITVIFRITSINTLFIILLSIIIAIFIATSITKPLYELNQKMKKVREGNMDVSIDIRGGEVGEISNTVQQMLNKINQLIQKIYKEEEEKRHAEMLALQAQINPHFLYNTLNTIKWMAHIQGVIGIENAIASLSSVLSFIAKTDGDFISIEEEIRFIRDYIKILNLRYYNKFQVAYEIDEEVYRYKTLKFLLQPVIENAVFHGFEGLDKKGEVNIKIFVSNDRVIFKVRDNGRGIEESVLRGILQDNGHESHRKLNAIGLSNVARRIKLHFGEQYGVSIDSIYGQGTEVTIEIPALDRKNSC